MPYTQKSVAFLRQISTILFAVILCTALPVFAATGINKQINFQGKVVNSDGTNVTNGDYSFVFKLYSVSSAGTAIWTESKTLTVTDGIFRTDLGDTTSLPGSVDFNTDNIYLGINFNSDGEMSPRVRFDAVPQAFNADALDGVDSGSFLRSDTSDNFTSGTLTFDDSTVLAIGTGNDLQFTHNGTDSSITSATGNLTINNTNATGATIAKLGTGTSATSFQIQNSSGTALFTINGAGTLTASAFSTNGGLLYTNGSGVLSQTGAGTSTTILHGGTTPTYGAVALTTDVSGTLPVANGGTGQTSYTDGQLLIGNSSGNTLTKAALTGTSNQVIVTNGNGSITLSTPQDIATSSSPQFSALGIGTAAISQQLVRAIGTTSGGVSQAGLVFAVTGDSGATTAIDGISGQILTSAASYTVTTGRGLRINDATLGSGSAITTQVGVDVLDQTKGGTNIGYRSQVSSGTNKWNAYFSGTANNYLAGNTSIGSTTTTSLFNVGSAAQFQVDSSGAIAAATGITSSGTITLSGLATAGLVTNTSAGVLSTLAGTSTTVLHGNASGLPTYGAVALSTDVSGTLPIANGGTNNSSAYTAGSVVYSDGTKLTQDNSNFFWDATNHRLGVGTTSPGAYLDVGTAAVGSKTYLNVGNTSNSQSTDKLIVLSTSSIGSGSYYIYAVPSTSGGSFTLRGDGQLALTSTGTSGATTASSLVLNANSLTTGTGFYAASSSLTSGKLADLQVSGTAAAASQTALNILTTGATASNAITTYGAQISNTHTNATSGTNVGLYLNASGATTANYGLIVDGGNVGIGTTAPTNKLDVRGIAAFASSDVSAIPGRVVVQDSTASAGTSLVITTNSNVGSSVLGLTFNDRISATSQGTEGQNASYIQSIRNGTTARYDLAFGTSDGTDLSADATTKMTILGSGNVGIGNTSPGGTLAIVSGNTSGTTTSAATSIVANSLTSGTGFYAASSSLTSGNLADLQVSGTAAAASQTALNILTTGATASNAITTYGAQISNTHTNATSGTNVALYLNASGATTANYGLIVNAGNVGIGTTTPASPLTTVGEILDVRNESTGDFGFRTLHSAGTANYAAFTVQSGSTYPFQLYNRQDLGFQVFYFRDKLLFNQGGANASGGTTFLTLLPANTTLDSTATTGTTTSAGLVINANSLTSGTGLYAASSSLTSGKLVDLQVSGTAAAASQTALNIATTGANATSGLTTYGAQISNTKTNGTSGTNVALYLNASGATTANYGLIVNAGNVGIGTTTPTSALHVVAAAQTVASASGAEYTTSTFTAPTITLTGTTQVTSVMDSHIFNPATITDSSAVTVNEASNLTVNGAPVKAGSVTLTNTYGLKVNTSAVSTATNSFGVYIDAQTGATNNYGLVVNTGNVGFGTTAPTSELHVVGPAKTIASSASANYTTSTFTAPTITLTGSTQVTAEMDSHVFNAPTITDATAVTVNSAATLAVSGAPIKAGSVTLTKTYGLRVIAGAVSTATSSYGAYIDAQTGATNNYGLVVATGNTGLGNTAPAQKLDVTGTIRQSNATNCALTTNASGDIACTSDERLKNIDGFYTGGLDQINAINPIRFQYKNESYVHVGFSAQNIQTVLPEGAPLQGNGYLGLDSNAVIALAINGIKQLDVRTKAIQDWMINPVVTGTLTVSGPTTLASLTIQGDSTIFGTLTAKSSATVHGELSIGSSQAGFAKLLQYAKSVRVVYDTPLKNIPLVQVTPQGDAGTFWISNSTLTGFTLNVSKVSDSDVVFGWTAISSTNPKTTVSDPGSAPTATPEPTPAPTDTPSPTDGPSPTPDPTPTSEPTPDAGT